MRDDGTDPDPSSQPSPTSRRPGVLRTLWIHLVIWPFVTFAATYLVLQVRFNTGHVRLTRNYAAERNAPALALPEDQRAWTHYRRICLALERRDQDVEDVWGDARPGDPLWPKVAAYLDRNAALIEEVRRTTELPNMGAFVTDQEDTALRTDSDPTAAMPGPPAGNPVAMGILLPHLGKSRSLARLIKEDTFHAAELGDAPRAADDIRSLTRLAHQNLGEDRTMIEQLVGIAVLSLACGLVQELIVEHPDLLNDTQWAAIDADIGAVAAATRLSFKGELDILADFEQRLFTDNGSGDGYVNAEGFAALGDLQGKHEPLNLEQRVFGPFMSMKTSRRAFREMSEAIYAAAADYAARARWQRTAELDDLVADSVASDVLGTFEYRIVSILIPSVGKSIRAQDMIEQTAHATRAAIALTRHRLRHGQYPVALADIDPDLATDPDPRDGFDGAPLRYRLAENWPLIYSVGSNLSDDGGALPSPPHKPFDAFGLPGVDGDWILFPPVEVNDDGRVTTPGPWPAERRKAPATGTLEPPSP